MRDEIPLTAEVTPRYLKWHQRAALKRFCYTDLRQATHSQTRLYGAFDAFSVLQFHADVQIRQNTLHCAVERLTGTGARFPDYPG